MKENTIVGCFFIALSAFLYVSKHFTAAIISIHMLQSEPGPINYFQYIYKDIGHGFSFWTFSSLVVGIIFLVRGKEGNMNIFKKKANPVGESKKANS